MFNSNVSALIFIYTLSLPSSEKACELVQWLNLDEMTHSCSQPLLHSWFLLEYDKDFENFQLPAYSQA